MGPNEELAWLRLTFLGTRGNTKVRSPRHFMHSSLLVASAGGRLMVDCGLDWLGHVADVRPDAILITHGHPDHAWGLAGGVPCPVYAAEETWAVLDPYPIDKHTLPPRQQAAILGLTVEPFALDHSILAPAVGYRLSDGDAAIFYSPDLVYIRERAEALHGVAVYVGDGATITRSMVRRRGNQLFGHTPIRTQLTWCEKERVPRAIFTHCGSQIVGGDDERTAEQVEAFATERGVTATIAYDGMEVALS
jgi:phosphoribosyl 1,2-cyclic phosphodiesterase